MRFLDKVPPTHHKHLTIFSFDDITGQYKLLRTEEKQGGVLCVIGIFRSPEQFVSVSRSLKHPFDDFVHVPDMLLHCVYDILTMGETSKRRIHTLMQCKRWSIDLEQVEDTNNDGSQICWLSEIPPFCGCKKITLLIDFNHVVCWSHRHVCWIPVGFSCSNHLC